MTVTVAPPFFYYLPNNNNTGAPAAGFKLFTYQAGTTTKQATWTDSTQTVTNANPILLDANGFIAASSGSGLFIDPSLSYKFVLALATDTDPPTSPLRTLDNVQGLATVSSLVASFIGSYGTDSGAVNAYVYTHAGGTVAAALATVGSLIRFTPLNTNTGASTLNADGTGAVAIIRANGSALTGGELSSLGPVVLQSTGTQWQIVSTAGAQPGYERQTPETTAGIVPLQYKFLPYWLPRYMTNAQLADYLANTALVDQTSALVSAEAVAYVGAIGKIYAPAGIYRVAGTQSLRSGVIIYGDSATSEYFPGSPYNTVQVTQFWKQSTDAAGPVFILNTSSALANLYVRSDAKANTGIIQKGPLGLNVAMFRSGLKRVSIYGNATSDVSGAKTCIGVYFPDGGVAAGGQIYFSEFDDVTITNCDRAISMHNQASANRFGNITTRQCYQHYYLSGANGLVATLSTITGGSGYVNGTYTYVGLTGGTGLGCVVNITVSGGAVTSVTLLAGGTGYSVNDLLTCSNSLLGGTGSGFTVKVATINNENTCVENSFTGLVLQNIGGLGFGLGAITGGTGYTSGTYNNVPLTGGTGSGMLGTFVVTGGIVTAVTITTFGTGYVVNDVLGVSNANLGGAGSGYAQTIINAGGSVCFTLKNTCQNNTFVGYSTECSGTAFNIDSTCLGNQFFGHENESGFASFVPPNSLNPLTQNVHGTYAQPTNRNQQSQMLIPNVATPNTFGNGLGNLVRHVQNISGTLPQTNGNGTLVANDVSSKVFCRLNTTVYTKASRPTVRFKMTVSMGTTGGGIGESIVTVEGQYRTTDNGTSAGNLSVTKVDKNPATSNSIAGLKFLTGVAATTSFGFAVVGGTAGAGNPATHLVVDLELLSFTHDTNTVSMLNYASQTWGCVAATANDVTDAIDLLTPGDTVV